MLNRWIGIALFGLMMAANSGLFMRDILPAWTAGDPPQAKVVRISPGEEHWSQTTIENQDRRIIGRSWSRLHRTSGNVATQRVETFINSFRLPNGVFLPPFHVQFQLIYHGSPEQLEEIEMFVEGLPMPLRLEGRLVSDQFACMWRIGPQNGRFILDAAATRTFGDALRPFDQLPNLVVGQSWRVRLLNPLAEMLPGFQTGQMESESMLVRVVATETVSHRGASIEAFRVEAPRVRAWVAPDGTVLRQEVDLPLLGMLRIMDEPHSRTLYDSTVEEFRSLIGPIDPEFHIGFQRGGDEGE
ncbi:MAG: hypothetical protein SF069_17165 [Phycisphaerae bacterium]|jgi:hypothetical protein|nr:hypothetical protein [Phycisphaerae bacterium]